MSELGNILAMLIRLGRDKASTETLMQQSGVSRRTVANYIKQAKGWGAVIRSEYDSERKAHFWVLDNWEEIENRVLTWYELETKRDLAAPFKLELML